MGLIESVLGYAKNLIVIESKVTALNDDIKNMAATLELVTDKLATLSERVSKIEGKFEVYETLAQRSQELRKQIEPPAK